MTEEDCVRHQNAFVNKEGQTVPVPPEGKFPIICGPWPTKVIGARQVRCEGCKAFLSVTEKGWLIHRERPLGRPFYCLGCYNRELDAMKKRKVH